MRIDALGCFLRSRKYVRSVLTVIVLTLCIGSLVLGERKLGRGLDGGESEIVTRVKNSKSTRLRRHGVDDDEVHDSEVVKAVVQSLSEWNERRIRRKLSSHRVKRDEEVVCYGELGCFRDEGPFDYLDMLPSPPDEISTRFLLYTRKNRQNSQTFSYFNFTTMYNSNFNATAPTKVIIHGFGSTCNRIWASEMRLTLLSVVECNVICVDWENGATLPNYVRAAVNTRLVGKQVALLILWLNEELGSRTQDFHLIGFSLGAHVAGFAGQELKNLSRITGLDPAGPLYESYDKKVRLDSSDALFVDVIHSNGDSLLMGGLGSWEPMGHVDFYPNGGKVQKGCSNLLLGAVRDFLWSGSENDGRSLCNHRRAYKFFTESISPRCPFPAFSCESYEKFLTGSCFTWDTTRSGNMGYFADRLPNPKQGLLYLVTREDEPFCANQYRITLESSPSSAPISTYGGIEAVLIGHDFINETFLLTKTLKENMVPGAVLQRLVVAHPAITEPIQIQLKYTAYQGWLYSGISRWSMDSLILTNAYGKSVSFCARLLLPSGIAVTIRLTPGVCHNRFSLPTNTVGRPIFSVYPFDPHPTATDSTNGIQGSSTSSEKNNTTGVFPSSPTLLENTDADLSIMKPPAMTQPSVGNNLNHYSETIGPTYHVMTPGPGQPWSQWYPLSAFTPVETFPHVEEENVTDDPKFTTNHNQSEAVSEIRIEKLRICLVTDGHNDTISDSNNETMLMKNMTCVLQSEDDGSGLITNGPVMSNSALGQIASYHQEILRENELFHHSANAVEVEPSNEDGPSTDLSIQMPPPSFWSSVHNKTQVTVSSEREHGQHRDPPMPPHLSYILQQLESQGLGPGPKVTPPDLRDRLSHSHHDANYLRALLDRDAATISKVTRRLVPSSRALKMRPVSLGVSGSGSGVSHRRQSKILDLNFSPSATDPLHGHFSSFSRVPDLRWLHPPPPRGPPTQNYGGTNNPIFYVTKNSTPMLKGYYLIPHFTQDITGRNGRLKIRRLLQSPQQALPAGITNETPPPQIKTYFEDFRQPPPPLLQRWGQ